MSRIPNAADLARAHESTTEWSASLVEEVASARGLSQWNFSPGSRFEPGALAPLSSARKLQIITFDGSDLDRENLLALAGIQSLWRLNLQRCRFNARDFRDLCAQFAGGACPRLSELWLEGASISHECLSAIASIPKLRWLILNNTEISDAGLDDLRGARGLETLWLQDTRVTDEGVLSLAVLPRLSIVAAQRSLASEDVGEQLFRAQVALSKSSRSLDQAQADAAGERLRAFLEEMESFEKQAWQSAQEIKGRHARTEPNVLGEEESREMNHFWRDLNARKAEIAERFCSPKLLARGAGVAQSYGDPPRFSGEEAAWFDIDTPSKKRALFYAAGRLSNKRRYTMAHSDGQWWLDEVQWWDGGWKRDHV